MFYGRIEELKELHERYNSTRFEMGIIYGARRIGKTSLLKEFIKDKKGIYFQAKESNELEKLDYECYNLERIIENLDNF